MFPPQLGNRLVCRDGVMRSARVGDWLVEPGPPCTRMWRWGRITAVSPDGKHLVVRWLGDRHDTVVLPTPTRRSRARTTSRRPRGTPSGCSRPHDRAPSDGTDRRVDRPPACSGARLDGTVVRLRELDEADAPLVAALLPATCRPTTGICASSAPAAVPPEAGSGGERPADVSLGAFRGES